MCVLKRIFSVLNLIRAGICFRNLSVHFFYFFPGKCWCFKLLLCRKETTTIKVNNNIVDNLFYLPVKHVLFVSFTEGDMGLQRKTILWWSILPYKIASDKTGNFICSGVEQIKETFELCWTNRKNNFYQPFISKHAYCHWCLVSRTLSIEDATIQQNGL